MTRDPGANPGFAFLTMLGWHRLPAGVLHALHRLEAGATQNSPNSHPILWSASDFHYECMRVTLELFRTPGMARLRQLVVVADDFGIGPETDRGILELGAAGRVTSAVLLSNSPHAEAAVAAWNRANRPIELGWHPALTIDRPILPPERVS